MDAKIAVILSLFITACSYYRKIKLPDNEQVYIFKCTEKESCFKEAEKACHKNFQIVEGSKIFSEKITLLVRCK